MSKYKVGDKMWTCEVMKPFGPKIFKIQLSEDVINKLTNITDTLIIQDDRKKNGCNLAGQIEEEIKIPNKVLKENNLYDLFKKYLKGYVDHCLSASGHVESDVIHYAGKTENVVTCDISSMWFNEMKSGEYNPAHFHTRCHVSSVLYLKIPKNRPKRNIECKEDKDGTINFIDRSVSPDLLQSGMLSIQPQEGEMYIWPSSLLHCVYPFLGDEVRRSIAWNGVYRLVNKEKGTIILGGTPSPGN